MHSEKVSGQQGQDQQRATQRRHQGPEQLLARAHQSGHQAVAGAVQRHGRLAGLELGVFLELQIGEAITLAQFAQLDGRQLVDEQQDRGALGLDQGPFVVGRNHRRGDDGRPALEQCVADHGYRQVRLRLELVHQLRQRRVHINCGIRLDVTPTHHGIFGALPIDDKHTLVFIIGEQGLAHVLLGVSPLHIDFTVEVVIGRGPIRIAGDVVFRGGDAILEGALGIEMRLAQIIRVELLRNVEQRGNRHQDAQDEQPPTATTRRRVIGVWRAVREGLSAVESIDLLLSFQRWLRYRERRGPSQSSPQP